MALSVWLGWSVLLLLLWLFCFIQQTNNEETFQDVKTSLSELTPDSSKQVLSFSSVVPLSSTEHSDLKCLPQVSLTSEGSPEESEHHTLEMKKPALQEYEEKNGWASEESPPDSLDESVDPEPKRPNGSSVHWKSALPVTAATSAAKQFSSTKQQCYEVSNSDKNYCSTSQQCYDVSSSSANCCTAAPLCLEVASTSTIVDAIKPNATPSYYENYSQMIEIMHLNIENKNQRMQLNTLSILNQELLADLQAQHDTFAGSLDVIMEALVAGIISKEQLRRMVVDLQKKMADLKQKNAELQLSATERFCSLPHSHNSKRATSLASSRTKQYSTASLPHAQQNKPARSARHTRQCNPVDSSSTWRNALGPVHEMPAHCSASQVNSVSPSNTGSSNSRPAVLLLARSTTEARDETCERGSGLRSTTSLPHLPACGLGWSRAAVRGVSTGRDEGYWTMGSNMPTTDSRTTLPRMSKVFPCSKELELCPASSCKISNINRSNVNTDRISLSETVTSNKQNDSAFNKESVPYIHASPTSNQLTSTLSFTSCNKSSTMPLLNTCPENSLLPPSKTHQSISLSGSKYLSPMHCNGLVRIISDMMNEIYVSSFSQANHNPSKVPKNSTKFPIKLSFVNSPKEAELGIVRGVYFLEFEACSSAKCSVCTDMLTRGMSVFEVYWPCPEGRKLQLIQMIKSCCGRQECEIACSGSTGLGHNKFTVTSNQINAMDLPDSTSVSNEVKAPSLGSSSPRTSPVAGAGPVLSSYGGCPPVTSSPPAVSSEPEFDQPELEWCGGSFQQPDPYWAAVHEFLPHSRESPRSGCSDQLALYPHDLSCGSYRGNLSSNSSRITDLDNVTDRLSDKFFDFRTGSCPDLTSDGCSDLLMPEGDMASLESCSEGDLMSLDNRYLDASRAYYSIVDVDVDMFSPSQQSGVLPSLHSLCFPPASSAHNSPTNSPLPPHPETSLQHEMHETDEFPDPPFPEPPVEEEDFREHLNNRSPVQQTVDINCSNDYDTATVSQPLHTDTPDDSSSRPPPLSFHMDTCVPAVPQHLNPVDSPSIPKRVTSRPLPSVPRRGSSVQHQPLITLADYSVAEHVERPESPLPVPPIRAGPGKVQTLSNSHRSVSSSHRNQHYGGGTSHTLSSVLSRCVPHHHPSVVYPPPLAAVMRPPRPPRAPRRSTSLLSSSRPVSSAEYPPITACEDNTSEGGCRSLSSDSSPLEGLESSWVRLTADVTTCPGVLQSPSSGEDTSSSTTRKTTGRKNKKGRAQGNCMTSIQ